MKLNRLSFSALAMLVSVATVWAADPIGNAVFSIGTTTTNAQGAHWAYILWQPTEPNALAGRKIAVYAKGGEATSDNHYVRKTVTQRQTDTLVIDAILNRSLHLGENLALLDTRINALFSAAVPAGNLSLAQKISGVIRGAQNDPQLLANIVFLGRLHPALNLCLGHAWAEPVSATGKTTFEIRDYDVANNKDLGVIGRVTVDPLNPIVLPAPGAPVQFHENSAQGDLVIKLRWATPNELREVGLLQHGFNLYRMTKSFAESNNFHMAIPTPVQLRNALFSAPNSVRLVNETPITVRKVYYATNVGDFSIDREWYIADDNNRYKPGGTNFINGAQYYYFATARDLLGRDGLLSAPCLAIACDRLPPEAPIGVKVENDYSFNIITGTKKQVLKVTWKQAANTNTNDLVGAYYVYRWTNAVEPTLIGPTNNLLKLIAGPIPHVNGQAYATYIDEGPNSPQSPADYGKTWWYTVRAVDLGACSNNFSANSAPAFGTLRDRTAPGEPTGIISILCCEPGVRSDKELFTGDSTQTDTNLAYYRFTVTTTNQSLAYAEFYFVDGTTNLIERVPFPPNKAPLVYDWTVNRNLVGGGTHKTFARIIAKDDKATPLLLGSDKLLPIPGARHDVNFIAWLECNRVNLAGGLAGRSECTHTPVDPEDGITIEPPIIIFLPAPGTKEFRLYRRVDGGPMTLIKQGPITNDPPVNVQQADPNPPANAAVLCYYLQCLDEHGNAGPMTQINDCLRWKFPTARPLISPITSQGDTNAPEMVITWFCPPFGVERFEVFINPAGGASMDADVSTNLTLKAGAQPVTNYVPVGPFQLPRKFYVYRTPRVGAQFGDGAFFQVSVKIDLNRTYNVFIKPVGLDGEPEPNSKNSRIESFTWTEKLVQGPKVPWPARPLPDISTNAFPAYVKPVVINTNISTNFVGVGLVVGLTDAPGRRREGTVPPRIDGFVGPMQWLAENEDHQSLFPLVVYRYQETNSLFPGKVSGDIVQVTPMMDRIAFRFENDPSLGIGAVIYDPFIDILRADLVGLPPGATARYAMVLLDTQPVILGARYRYILARFGTDGEIAEVIPTAPVEVELF